MNDLIASNKKVLNWKKIETFATTIKIIHLRKSFKIEKRALLRSN